MKTLLAAWIALGIVVGLHAPVAAQTPQTVSPQRLQQQKQVQQQASDIARQLVGEVLDVQLQQFRDNNLTSHPWYGEIRSMRDHLDEMVNKQMKEVVDILEKADLNDDAQRVKAFQAARSKSREILVRIQVEQQILLRRLKIAELARQIQQLIEHQTKVRKETEALPGEAGRSPPRAEPGRPGRPARRDRQLRAVQAEPAARRVTSPARWAGRPPRPCRWWRSSRSTDC